MRSDRSTWAELFLKVGLFRLTDLLVNQGVAHLAEQVAIVCLYVVEPSGRAPPRQSDSSPELERWANDALLLATARWRERARGGSGKELLGRAASSTGADLYRDLGDLFAVRCGPRAFDRAWMRLKRTGLRVSWHLLYDLSDEFASYSLPRAMRTFDIHRGAGHELEWFSTVFYRFAVRSIVSDQLNRKQLAGLETVWGSTPEEDLELAEEHRAEAELPDALSAMAQEKRTCLVAYFGLTGRERTLGEIGSTLELSEYHTRNLVISSLAELAVRLGVQGSLEDREYLFAKLLFVEGMNPKGAAQQVGAPLTEISTSLLKKFRKVLRTRTVRRNPTVENQETTTP